jgi:hypothetical protein
MKEGQTLWTREELILALNLYFKTPFGKLHSTNPDVVHLSKLIGRTPGSVAYKLVNLASLDKTYRQEASKVQLMRAILIEKSGKSFTKIGQTWLMKAKSCWQRKKAKIF